MKYSLSHFQIKKSQLLYIVRILVATFAAICLAKIIALDYAISAGIVAILSVQATKRETVKTAWHRFVAFACALVISFICFSIFGFTTLGFVIYLVIFIPLCVCMGWLSAMAMDSVLISHFLTLGNMGGAALTNEILLFVIGVGMGIIVNLTLFGNESYIARMKNETDQLIKQALKRMSMRMLDENLEGYDGSCFNTMRLCVAEALSAAKENALNSFSDDGSDMQYIKMRADQIDILFEMYKKVSNLNTTPSTAKILSDFFLYVSEEYSEENTVQNLLDKYYDIERGMEREDLPSSRMEFEDRAKLFGLMKNMEEFLLLKKTYADKWIEEK